MSIETEETSLQSMKARRRFLANCGRFALVTPPAISLILAQSHGNYAMALSGGHHGGGHHGGRGRGHGRGGRHANNGFGNGGRDGVPGRSGSNGGRNAGEKLADNHR